MKTYINQIAIKSIIGKKFLVGNGWNVLVETFDYSSVSFDDFPYLVELDLFCNFDPKSTLFVISHISVS